MYSIPIHGKEAALYLFRQSFRRAGDVVKDAAGVIIPSQRLSTGELAFVAKEVPPFAVKKYTIFPGKASAAEVKVNASSNTLDNGIVTVSIDETYRCN